MGNKLDIGSHWGMLFAKVTLLLCSFILLLYGVYIFISPSVTINNQSNHLIESAIINLPHSRLDFGDIGVADKNTIHYDLAQFDGQYQFEFTLDNGDVIQGVCGYVTNMEFNKRVIVTLSKKHLIKCAF